MLSKSTYLSDSTIIINLFIQCLGNAAVCKVIYKDGRFFLESFGDMGYVEKGKAISQ